MQWETLTAGRIIFFASDSPNVLLDKCLLYLAITLRSSELTAGGLMAGRRISEHGPSQYQYQYLEYKLLRAILK